MAGGTRSAADPDSGRPISPTQSALSPRRLGDVRIRVTQMRRAKAAGCSPSLAIFAG